MILALTGVSLLNGIDAVPFRPTCIHLSVAEINII
jgi:hypothetical protein